MDKKELQELLLFIEKLNVKELEIENEGLRIKMVKPYGEVLSVQAEQHSTGLEAAAINEKGEVATEGESILAPLPSIFYSAAGPDETDFVMVGKQVKKGETVCILEAMKMMNEIQMPKDGVITSICVNNGDAVDADQQLFTYSAQ